jgi:Flp pilus assembly protein CpaB
MAAGEVLTDFLIFIPDTGGLETVLQPGEVAMTIRVAEGSVDGFAQPGFRVNILATTTRTTPEGPKPITEALLKDVEILAMQTEDGQGAMNNAGVYKVTVRLNRDDANLLNASANSPGLLRLELRPLEAK